MSVIKKYSDLPERKVDLIGKKLSVKYESNGQPFEKCFLITQLDHNPTDYNVSLFFSNSDLYGPFTYSVQISNSGVKIQFICKGDSEVPYKTIEVLIF